MIALTSQHRYFLYRRAVDMRKSFDGLSGLGHRHSWSAIAGTNPER